MRTLWIVGGLCGALLLAIVALVGPPLLRGQTAAPPRAAGATRAAVADAVDPQHGAEPHSSIGIAPPTAKDAPPAAPEATPSRDARTGVRWARTDAARLAGDRLDQARRALQDDPRSVAALRDAAQALADLERWEEAAQLLAQLRELRPDDAALIFECGVVHLRLRRWIEAIRDFQSVTALTPQDARAWFNLAAANQAARRLDAAELAWSRVLELTPDDPLARAHRGETRLDLRAWSAAEADFRALVERAPDDAAARLNLALALQAQGGAREALEVLETGLQRRPRDVRLLNRAASILAAPQDGSGPPAQQAAAIDYCRRSLAIDPSQPEIAALLAELLATERQPGADRP